MTSSPELLDLATRVAGMVQGGEQVEVYASRGRATSVKAYEGEVESFTSAESFGIGVRVVRADKRQGFASAGSLDEGIVAEVLADARDNAAFAEPDEWAGVAEPDGVDVTPIELWHPALLELGTEAKVALAIELERVVRAGDPRIAGVRSAAYGDSAGEGAVATSTGIAVYDRATFCHLAVTALARDGDETQVGGGVAVGREPGELDLAEAAADAVERATRLLGARQPPSQRLTVVLEPRLAATLLGIVGGMLRGDVVLKGRSPFADRVGEQIASPLLTYVDDPTDHRSLAADSHDGEGLATRRNALIADGVLQGFLHDTYTGRRSGAGSTGSAVRGSRSTPTPGLQAPALRPGARDLDTIVAGLDGALLVQSMHGLHSGVNAVSGDFSVGADGVMIRDGALAEPVREVTLASTLQRLLLDVVEVGNDLEWLPGGSGAPTLVIADVALSGK